MSSEQAAPLVLCADCFNWHEPIPHPSVRGRLAVVHCPVSDKSTIYDIPVPSWNRKS